MDTMSIAQLVLEYLKILLWPIVLITILLFNKKKIKNLIKHFTEDTDEISLRLANIFELSAKYKKDLEEFSNNTKETPEIESQIESLKIGFSESHYRVLCSYFNDVSINIRRQIAEQVALLSYELPLDKMLKYVESPFTGERIGAGILLGEYFKRNHYKDNEQLRDSILLGLTDVNSRVRFRFVEAIGNNVDLMKEFFGIIKEMSISDENNPIRKKCSRLIVSFDGLK